MAIKNISLLAALALSGCAVFAPFEEMVGLDEEVQETELFQNLDDGSTLSSSVNFKRQFAQKFQQQIHQNQTANIAQHDINHYVRGLMQDLVANLQYVNSTTPVAVVSFVMLNSDYNDANLLGIQIAESLIHEVHKFGIPVIDFKTTGYIRVTEQGDFAFSKDYQDFTGDMPARYIVGGTLLKHTDGYLVNARIVGMQSQAVVASAQSFIPNSVTDPILMMSANPTLPNSPISNETVELGSVAFPAALEPALSTRNTASTQATKQQTGSMAQLANAPFTNKVFLIQE
jgi:TolB-like protein